jgi:Short C-terminal domain
MGIKIVKDQFGNVYAKGGTDGGNFLNAIGILCFIIGGIGLIGVFAGGATSLIGVGTISAIIGTIFIYGGSHNINKARQKKLEEYMLQLQLQLQQQQQHLPQQQLEKQQQLELQKQQELERQQQLERTQKSPDEEELKVEAQKKQTFEIKESIADELLKLANLKEKGILSEEEFLKMKQDLINKASH